MTPLLAAALATLIIVGLAAFRSRYLLRDSGKFAVRLVRHPEVPWPLRWLFVVALLPLPGPIHWLVGGLAVLLLVRIRPRLIQTTWRAIRAERDYPPAG